MAIEARVVLRGLDLSGSFGLYLSAGSGLLLKACRFSNPEEQASLASMERGSIALPSPLGHNVATVSE